MRKLQLGVFLFNMRALNTYTTSMRAISDEFSPVEGGVFYV